MRTLALLLLLSPLMAGAQSKARKIMLVGSVRTAPSGTRFAIGTRLGIFSVETKGAKFALAGRAAAFTDLRLGSSVTVLGTLTPAAAGARATIVATRIEIAPAASPGTSKPRKASKKV